MIKLARYLRDRKQSTRMIAYLILFWAIFGVALQTLRSLLGDNPLQYALVTHFYFTTQSNYLIVIVMCIYLFAKKKGLFFSKLAFITLINISVTGIVFHMLLTPYMPNVSFLNHVLHTINPLLYIFFYFLINDQLIKTKQFYLALFYPLFYMLFVYIIVEPLFGDMMDNLISTFETARYVYPFLDPNNYARGIPGLLVFNLGILAPLVTLFSLFVAYLKSKLELKISQKEKEEAQSF